MRRLYWLTITELVLLSGAPGHAATIPPLRDHEPRNLHRLVVEVKACAAMYLPLVHDVQIRLTNRPVPNERRLVNKGEQACDEIYLDFTNGKNKPYEQAVKVIQAWLGAMWYAWQTFETLAVDVGKVNLQVTRQLQRQLPGLKIKRQRLSATMHFIAVSYGIR